MLTGAMTGSKSGTDMAAGRFADRLDLIAATPASMMALAPHFARHIDLMDPAPFGATLSGVHELQSIDESWARALLQDGYTGYASVRYPLVDSLGYEFMLLSRAGVLQPMDRALAVLIVHDYLPRIREALAPRSVRLSLRERECMRYAFRGASAQEIARVLLCSEPNVRDHLDKAARKLGGSSTIERVRIALSLGVL